MLTCPNEKPCYYINVPRSIRWERSHGATCTDISNPDEDFPAEVAAWEAFVGEGVATTKPAPLVERLSGGDCKAVLLGRLVVTLKIKKMTWVIRNLLST